MYIYLIKQISSNATSRYLIELLSQFFFFFQKEEDKSFDQDKIIDLYKSK